MATDDGGDVDQAVCVSCYRFQARGLMIATDKGLMCMACWTGDRRQRDEEE